MFFSGKHGGAESEMPTVCALGDGDSSASSELEHKQKKDGEVLAAECTRQTTVGAGQVKTHKVKWWQAAALMVAEIVSLGVLSLPEAVATLGFGPGLAIIVGFGLISTYTGYQIMSFKLNHPWVKDMGDVGRLLLKPFGCPNVGWWIFTVAQSVFLVFIAAAHILTFSIMMNVLTDHSACTIIFAFVGALISFILCIPRRQGTISIWAFVSCASIVLAVVLCIVGISISDPGGSIVSALPKSTLTVAPAMVAVMDVVLAFAGNVAFLAFIDEMEKPKDFPKALAVLQISAITFYTIVASVIYHYAGDNIASPALSSAPPMWMKIGYGVAIPTIVVAGVINGHVAVTQMYKATCSAATIEGKGLRSWTLWLSINIPIWIISWVIAEAIPDFSALLALISALFGSWFTYGIGAWMYLYDFTHGEYNTTHWRTKLQRAVCCCLLLLTLVLMGLGTYSSIEVIIGDGGGLGFSCADNAPKSHAA